MAILGALTVNLAANASNFKKTMRESGKELGTFSKSAKKAMAGVGAMAAGVVSVRAMGGAIAAAQTQMQAEAKLQAVIAATGGAAGLSAEQIKGYAGELQNMTNFGDEATINAAAMLATFKEIKGEAFLETLAAAQDMSAVLGTDLKGSVIQLGKALNDPITGLSALSRSGVSFTEQQKEQIRTLQESGDILGAQRIILNELSSEFGGAAAAMADPITQLSNDMGDFGEVVGAVAANIIGQFVPGLRATFKYFTALLAPVKSSIALFGGLAVKTLGVIGVIAAVIKVILLLINALKAARAAQIAFLAMTGPVGWGMIAAGVGVTVAAVAGLEYALDDASDSANKLEKNMQIKAAKLDQPGAAGGPAAPTVESPFTKSMKAASQQLEDLKNKTTAHEKEARKLLEGGATQKQVDQLIAVRKEMDAINEQRKKEAELAQQRESRQKNFNGLIEDTRKRLGEQLGTISKIDSVIDKQRKLGIDESQLKKLRNLLEYEESVIKGKEAAQKIAEEEKRRKEQFESDVESQMKSNMSSEEAANKKLADGGTMGSAKAAQTILKATRETPMVSQQKMTNKTLAKIQVLMKKRQKEAFEQGAIA